MKEAAIQEAKDRFAKLREEHRGKFEAQEKRFQEKKEGFQREKRELEKEVRRASLDLAKAVKAKESANKEIVRLKTDLEQLQLELDPITKTLEENQREKQTALWLQKERRDMYRTLAKRASSAVTLLGARDFSVPQTLAEGGDGAFL